MLHPAARRSLVGGATAGVAFVALRALARPLPDQGDRTLVDWARVQGVAGRRCGERANVLRGTDELGARYDRHAIEVAPLMEAICQSVPTGFPRFTVLDRRGFIDTNVRIAQRLLTPVEELRAHLHESRATAMGRSMMSRYIGEVFGFISKRVLGQYDPVLMLSEPLIGETPSLYLVEPNMARFQRTSGLPAESLHRYLILHELTHAWQFGSHPWLRDHIATVMRDALMTGMLEHAGGRESGPRLPAGNIVRMMPGHMRLQLQAVNRIQAVMSVLEGYSNFVMHRVGRRHLANFDDLERAFHQRSTQRSTLERVTLTVTGMAMKLRQYELGEQFSVAVTERGGLDLLNRVWDGPDHLPSMTELRDPSRWVARVG